MIPSDSNHPPEANPRITGLLLDFDGVICPNATPLLLRAVHQFVQARTPISEDAVRDLSKGLTAFPMKKGLGTLLSGLGIGDDLPVLSRELADSDAVDAEYFALAPGFADFLSRCADSGLRTLVCSTMDETTRRRKLVEEFYTDTDFLPIGKRSKADPATYTQTLRELGEAASPSWILVDDSPLALRAAKLAGLTTAMVPNSVFTPADRDPYSEFIDHTVDSLSSLPRVVPGGTFLNRSPQP